LRSNGPARRADPALCAIEHGWTSALWPKTSFVRELEEIAALNSNRQELYLVGALELRRALSMPGLVDELPLIVYPLIAGEGRRSLATTGMSSWLEVRKVQQASRWACKPDLRNRLKGQRSSAPLDSTEQRDEQDARHWRVEAMNM